MVFWKRQPLGHQLAAVGLEPLVEQLRAENAVDAKIAKISSQFAPRTEKGHVEIIRHRDRPDRSLRASAFFVDIGDRELARLADRVAQLGLVNPVGTAGALPSDTKSGAATSCDCNSRGTTAASLASTLSAAFWSFGSRRRRNSRTPIAIASVSSSVNIKGGRSKPRRNT